MAKDPAFLFYYQDFLVGTDDFTNEEVGAYIRCLCIQAAKGGISENHMKKICESPAIQNLIKIKFIWYPEEKVFKNERLSQEIEKRKKYCESRGNNKKGKKHVKIISKSYDSHMENENENENENVFKGGVGENHEGLCWDIEQHLLKNQKDMEAICMNTKKTFDELKSILTNFHLWNVQNEVYPKKPLPLMAGFTRWVLNDKKFNKNGSNSKLPSEVGRTLKRDKL